MPIQQLKPSITATKISETEIEITKDVPKPEPVVNNYRRDFIESQKKAIQAQWDSHIASINAMRQAEIDKCDAILKEMDKLGIKPTEVVE